MTKKQANILIVDDNPDVLIATKMLLKQHYSHVETENNPHQLAQHIQQKQYHVILLDMNFTRDSISGEEGFYWLKQIKAMDQDVAVVMFTAFGDMNTAIDAIKAGANDFVLKPWQNEKLLATVANCVALNESKRQVSHLSALENVRQAQQNKPFEHLIAQSPAMSLVFSTIEKAAKTDANVLILGESGTGKELIARELHRQSARNDKVFLSVDMGTIAESLFESELFGHKRGAFTDAKENRKGRFELAHNGTLFLDEIGNISLASQGKLLTAIQNRVITPVGSGQEKAVDIRLVTATNMPLYDMVREGSFRQDLLYRINTVEVQLPALRNRPQDIPLLIEFYVQKYCEKYQLPMKTVSDKEMENLCHYYWPGNIRELQHLVERAVILAEDGQLSFQLPQQHQSTSDVSQQTYNLAEIERITVDNVMREFKGNVSHAAKALGITRTSLYRKLEKYDL